MVAALDPELVCPVSGPISSSSQRYSDGCAGDHRCGCRSSSSNKLISPVHGEQVLEARWIPRPCGSKTLSPKRSSSFEEPGLYNLTLREACASWEVSTAVSTRNRSMEIAGTYTRFTYRYRP